ncbi:hypothetical protein MPSEU_000350400 [Mayamaea pseudoterrestris]|nr:hypothetical protein MPSEU_000350400 [Mayamaea pseudoterrestris]
MMSEQPIWKIPGPFFPKGKVTLEHARLVFEFQQGAPPRNNIHPTDEIIQAYKKELEDMVKTIYEITRNEFVRVVVTEARRHPSMLRNGHFPVDWIDIKTIYANKSPMYCEETQKAMLFIQHSPFEGENAKTWDLKVERKILDHFHAEYMSPTEGKLNERLAAKFRNHPGESIKMKVSAKRAELVKELQVISSKHHACFIGSNTRTVVGQSYTKISFNDGSRSVKGVLVTLTEEKAAAKLESKKRKVANGPVEPSAVRPGITAAVSARLEEYVLEGLQRGEISYGFFQGFVEHGFISESALQAMLNTTSRLERDQTGHNHLEALTTPSPNQVAAGAVTPVQLEHQAATAPTSAPKHKSQDMFIEGPTSPEQNDCGHKDPDCYKLETDITHFNPGWLAKTPGAARSCAKCTSLLFMTMKQGAPVHVCKDAADTVSACLHALCNGCFEIMKDASCSSVVG